MSQVIRIVAVFMMLLFAGCATGRSTFVEGQRLEQQGNLDEAVKRYTQAAIENPDSKEVRARLLKAREDSAQVHFRKGQEALRLRNLEEAVTELETAYGLNPGLQRAQEYAAQASRLRDARIMVRE